MGEPEINLEEGSAEVTLTDVYAMFYLMLLQNQVISPGCRVAFDVNAFKTLPKKVSINFVRQDGKLYAWIPEKPKDRKKSIIAVPQHKIITVN